MASCGPIGNRPPRPRRYDGEVESKVPDELDEFARLLVEQVRDRAIQSCEILLSPTARDPAAKSWREAVANSSSADTLARIMMLAAVDSAVFNLLEAIDQGVLKLTYTSSNGATLDLCKLAGEFAGWYVVDNSESWRHRYSKEPVSVPSSPLSG